MKTQFLVCAMVFAAGCAQSLPPKELEDARHAYLHAANGPAGQVKPANVYEAKQALDRAESAYVKGDDRTRDLSYIALRRAEYAEALADATIAEQEYAQADKDMRTLTGRALENARNQIGVQQQALEQTRAVAQNAQMNANQARADADKERQARIEAERRAKQALDDLGKIAAIKEEQRGMVITLTGNVLFASAKWELLPTAQVKLNEVADALKQTKRAIVIEGHTDSQGAAGYNVELGQHRAESVRDYLVSRGVDSSRIRAIGIGPARPIADNATPEGRANNRRVEIVVSPPEEAR